MLISSKKKFIFIHIYKTAGTSVSKLFVPHARLIDRIAYDFKLTSSSIGKLTNILNWQDDGFIQFTGFHKHSKAYEIKEKIGDEKYNKYFKFVFVRNPFDLLVSLYHYIKQTPNHLSHNKASNLTFKEFVFDYISQKPNRQIDFITDLNSDEIIVDYIGRFEFLSRDVEVVKNKLNIRTSEKLSHKNSSKGRNNHSYRDFYDKETIDLVSEYFIADLNLLNYSF
jgi:hypothetical protein